MTVSFDEKACLEANPFEGDFGMPGDRTLRIGIVRARIRHECGQCYGEIQPGERYRNQVEFFEGSVQYYKWCSDWLPGPRLLMSL